MNKKAIKKKAKDMKKKYGGRIFAFPIDEEDPFSKYALIVDLGVKLDVFPEQLGIEEAAQCIFEAIDMFNRNNIKVSYEKDVKFIFHEAQLNSFSTTMRRLRNGQYLN